MAHSEQTYHVMIFNQDLKERDSIANLLVSDDDIEYDILHADSVEQALDQYHSQQLDCILLDQHENTHDIVNFIHALATEETTIKSPIIVLAEQLDDEIESERANVDDYLIKQKLDAAQLQQAVVKAISAHVQQDNDEEIELTDNSTSLLRNVLESITQGVCVYDKNFNLISWNQRFLEILRLPSDFLDVPRNIEDMIRFNAQRGEYGDGDPEAITAARIAEIYDSKDIKPHCYERMRSDGTYVEVRGNRLQGGGLVTTYTDVTTRKKAEELIKELALNDSLTGLANRNLFHRRLEDAVSLAKRNKKSVALMLLDLDKFKAVNDTFGHPIGDELLKVVSERLNECIRSVDTAARLGGDEFAVIVTEITDLDSVKLPARRIIEYISQPYDIRGNRLIIGTSIGISFFPKDDNDIEELIRKADVALYEAKTGGRGNYQIYCHEMDDEARTMKIIEDEIRMAIPNDELFLVYQPQFSAFDKSVIGLEVFLKWQHPRRGILNATEFIHVAEACGLIIPIGEWVLEQAARQVQVWRDAGMENLRISLNISIKQFQTDDLFDKIKLVLKETNMDPHCLELEINENTAMKNIEHINLLLNQLKDLGVCLAIGNFGVGLTSFNHLRTFPISRLKLDSSFIQGMFESESDRAIIEAIMILAKGLDLKCTAVGIENEQQYLSLIELGCDEIQGRYFCPALTSDKFSEWMTSYKRAS